MEHDNERFVAAAVKREYWSCRLGPEAGGRDCAEEPPVVGSRPSLRACGSQGSCSGFIQAAECTERTQTRQG